MNGTAPGNNGVMPLAPNQVIMLNRMNVLAVRAGDDFRFGRYEENDQQRTLVLALFRVTENDLNKLPPSGQLDARRKALERYPLGFNVHGKIEQLDAGRAVARFSSAADSSTFVAVLRRE